ncbi:hypothetical protein EMMF5_004799 [Cystobasidiomycetes sp. EMM_F5]
MSSRAASRAATSVGEPSGSSAASTSSTTMSPVRASALRKQQSYSGLGVAASNHAKNYPSISIESPSDDVFDDNSDYGSSSTKLKQSAVVSNRHDSPSRVPSRLDRSAKASLGSGAFIGSVRDDATVHPAGLMASPPLPNHDYASHGARGGQSLRSHRAGSSISYAYEKNARGKKSSFAAAASAFVPAALSGFTQSSGYRRSSLADRRAMYDGLQSRTLSGRVVLYLRRRSVFELLSRIAFIVALCVFVTALYGYGSDVGPMLPYGVFGNADRKGLLLKHTPEYVAIHADNDVYGRVEGQAKDAADKYAAARDKFDEEQERPQQKQRQKQKQLQLQKQRQDQEQQQRLEQQHRDSRERQAARVQDAVQIARLAKDDAEKEIQPPAARVPGNHADHVEQYEAGDEREVDDASDEVEARSGEAEIHDSGRQRRPAAKADKQVKQDVVPARDSTSEDQPKRRVMKAPVGAKGKGGGGKGFVNAKEEQERSDMDNKKMQGGSADDDASAFERNLAMKNRKVGVGARQADDGEAGSELE